MSANAADAESLRAWWAKLLVDEPPPAETRALWFGLFEATDGITLYVQGYPTFDSDDESAEWATGAPSWSPEARYVRLPSLTAAASWQEALDNALRLLGQLQPQNGWPFDLEGIAAGFDDGDAHLIWTHRD